MNKKGVSEIVLSVLLIIIAVSLVAIIFVYVIDYSNKPLSLSPQECISMQSNPPISIVSACFNSNNGDVEVKLSRGVDDFDITSIKISVDAGLKSHSYSCDNSCSSCTPPSSGESKYYYVTSNSDIKPFSLELLINDCARIVTNKISDC